MAALRDQQREETRRRLYDAALEVFRRDGVAGCRIDDIVRAAGVSRGSFYFHFPTKDDVLIELMRETERKITSALDALPTEAELQSVLATVVSSLVGIWEEDPSLLPEVASAGLRSAASALAETEQGGLRMLLATRFRAAARRGELSSLLPPEILSDLYLGHMLGGLLAWFGNKQASMRGVLEGVTLLFWNGARGESQAPPTATTPRRSPRRAATPGKRLAASKPKAAAAPRTLSRPRKRRS
jgi:AcrR family transcriptional regulator